MEGSLDRLKIVLMSLLMFVGSNKLLINNRINDLNSYQLIRLELI